MAALPPVTLGAIIFGAFSIGFAARHPLQRRWVVSAPVSKQPKRQFAVESASVLLAGVVAVAFNTAVFDFPISSGVSLLFGCLVSGFFIGLDLSLARERVIILDAIKHHSDLPEDRRFFPVTRKFTKRLFWRRSFRSPMKSSS